MSARKITESALEGTITGTSFDGTPAPEYLSQAVITRIVVWSSIYFDGISIYYTNNKPLPFNSGRSGGTKSELIVEEDEIITAVEGSVYSDVIGKVLFVTNKRRWGPFGQTAGLHFSLTAESTPVSALPQMGLISLSGWSCSTYIRALQAKFALPPYRENQTGIVSYENQQKSNSRDDITTKLPLFARNLMSQVVTLVVGPNKTVFHVSESILCGLPFFQAALKGSFLEATTKSIALPEDSTLVVAAILEFLYTGRYTYAHTSAPAGTDPADNKEATPKGTLSEVKFHLSVFALASKYDCQKLVEGSICGAAHALYDLGGMDIMHSLTAAYEKGLALEDLEKHKDFNHFMAGFEGCLRALYGKYRIEIDQLLLEYPELARDVVGHLLTRERTT